MPMTVGFEQTLRERLKAISTRDLESFRSHVSRQAPLYTIVQNGHAFTTPEELIAVHEEWFKDRQWSWTGSVIHTVVGRDVAFALVRYDYSPKAGDAPLPSWLTYVFRLEEDGQWRIVHDQSTSLDYPAFAHAAGLDV